MNRKRITGFFGMTLLALAVTRGLSADPIVASHWQSEYQTGRAQYEAGETDRAVLTLRVAASDAVTHGASKLEYARILDSLGASCEAEGLLREAKTALDQALAIRRGLLPAADQEIAVSLTNESSVEWAMVKPDDAIQDALTAKHMWEQLKQTNRREYAITVNNLVAAYRLKGQMREAKSLMEEASAVFTSTLDAADPFKAQSLATLAASYKAAGDYDTAERLSWQAVALAEKNNENPAARAFLITGLADMRLAQGRLKEAESLMREALALSPDSSGAHRVQRAIMYRVLSSVHRHQGRYDEAQRELDTALSLLEGKVGQADAERGVVLNHLGMLATDCKQPKKAEQYFRQAISQLEKTYGNDEANISAAYSNLAELYASEHHFDKAQNLYDRLLAVDREALPEEHPFIARDLNNLGSLAFKQHHLEHAQDLFEQAHRMFEKTLGPSSSEAAVVEANLANTLSERRDAAGARAHYTKALRILEQTWGPDNPRLMDLLANYTKFSRANKDAALAEELEVRMERIRVKTALQRERDSLKS